MRTVVSLAAFFAFAPAFLPAQPATSPAVELANMREEFRLMQQTLGNLVIRVEQLEEANTRLAKTAAGAEQTYATLTQLNTAIADLSRDITAAQASTRSEILATVGTQMEILAKQTNAALDSVTRARAASTPAVPAAPVVFSDDFPKEGITYAVVAGDTVSRIAQKTGAKAADIINANKLVDPSKILAGQVLFIPGGK